MSSIVNSMAFGSGFYNPANHSGDWNLTLNFTPTPGNTLIIAGSLPESQVIDYIVYGETGLSSVLSGVPIFVLTCIVPESPGVTISAIGEMYNCPGFVLEVSGISDTTPDRTSTSSGGPTATYDTGATLETRNATEYWLNVYAYYNPSTDYDSQGSDPSNGYNLYDEGIPITGGTSGWIPTVIYGTGAPSYSYGLIFADQFVASQGYGGGTIADSNDNESYYAAGALTWSTTS